MSTELGRITHPLRLAAGSHVPGSDRGCAMNIISYIVGDSTITDYPTCSAKPLARLVQALNDRLADYGNDGYLTPQDSITVLDLGWRTVGTAAVNRNIALQWFIELLTDPQWGVLRHAPPGRQTLVTDVAALCGRALRGVGIDESEVAEATDRARLAAYEYFGSEHASLQTAYYVAAWLHRSNPDYASRAWIDAADEAAASHACDAHNIEDAATARVEFTRWAITRWRGLAGMETPAPIDAAAIGDALKHIGAH